jgi:hypothetical protein
MSFEMRSVEKIDLGEVRLGESIQITGSVEGRATTLGIDIFKQSGDWFFAAGFAERQGDNGEAEIDTNLTYRFYRLPLVGVIETGDITMESVALPDKFAGIVEKLRDGSWTPFVISCIALEYFSDTAQ